MSDNQNKTQPSIQQETQTDQTAIIYPPILEKPTVVSTTSPRQQKSSPNKFSIPSWLYVFIFVHFCTALYNGRDHLYKDNSPEQETYAEIQTKFLKGSAIILDESQRAKLKKDADSGNNSAQWIMANCLENGSCGFVADEPKALAYAQQSAKTGNSLGMCVLGALKMRDIGGLKKDTVEAVNWFRKSAEAENSSGMCLLGLMYLLGEGGLPKSSVEGLNWIRKSAEAGNSNGMVSLGRLYEIGWNGIAKNDFEAVNWYRDSAEAGNVLGMFHLAVM
jgi:TPR repeat protein